MSSSLGNTNNPLLMAINIHHVVFDNTGTSLTDDASSCMSATDASRRKARILLEQCYNDAANLVLFAFHYLVCGNCSWIIFLHP